MPTKPTIESLIAPSVRTRVATGPVQDSMHYRQFDSVEPGSPTSSTSESEVSNNGVASSSYHYSPTDNGSVFQRRRTPERRRMTRDESPENSCRSYTPAESTSSGSLATSSPHPFLPFLRVLPSHPRSYELVVVQQPYTAAEFGKHDLSRIPLAPPLFVRLVVRDNTGAVIQAVDDEPFLVAAITLHKASLPPLEGFSWNSELYGTTISSPQNLKDVNGTRGVFFVYPDVGIRLQGTWRLHVSLLRIAKVGSRTILEDGATGSQLTGVWTRPFEVVPVEGYIAPQVTTLTRHFQSQGVRMFVSNSVVTH